MRTRNLILPALPFALISVLISGCDWVDSAGRENNSTPVTELILEDGQAAGPQILREQSTRPFTFKGSDTDGSVRNWGWSSAPVAQGDLLECRGLTGFPGDLSAESLEAACSSQDDCRLQFELQSSDTDTAAFLLSAPELNAPVGVRYQLVATDNDGGRGSAEYTFCLLSENTPPKPADDSFTVLEGQLLNVTANDINLLSNDIDDTEEITSKPLRVETTPVTAPASADVFELRADGGFSYSFRGSNLQQDVTDRFEYAVTDGQYTVNASVTLNVVARNDPPEANGNIVPLEEIAGIDFTLDFADFYSDPEGNTLGFSVLNGDFPESGGITLSPIGVLSGAGEEIDVGDYVFTLLVSDGVASTDAEISLTILDNEPVEVSTIPDQTVEANSSVTLAVGARFSDPERQPMSFTIDSSDSDVNLSVNPRTGVIAGFISEEGEFDVEVSASDGYNTPSSATVTFIVEAGNSPPVFFGSIADQSIRFGRSISRIRPVFSDVDSDTLTYRLQGLSPTGLTLSSRGELTGRPLQTGVFSGLRILATDPDGLSARSNAFTISVVR